MSFGLWTWVGPENHVLTSLVVLETAVLVSRPKFCGLGLCLVTAGLDYNTGIKGGTDPRRRKKQF